MNKNAVVILMLVVIAISVVEIKIAEWGGFDSTTREFEVYSTNAPDGIYWKHTHGGGGLFFRYYNSELTETYIIKYMDNDILKTLIVPSTSEKLDVHITDDNTTMRFIITYQDDINTDYNGIENWSKTYDLYIPAPELCEIPRGII